MGSFSVSLPANWEEFLKRLADDHEIGVSKVISGLCEWAFSSSESKIQFEVWLIRLIRQKVKLKIEQKLKEKKQARVKKKGKMRRKKKPMRTETTVKTEI